LSVIAPHWESHDIPTLHDRIIPYRAQPEQGIPAAVVNVGSIAGGRVDSTRMIGLAFNWPKREVS
jgi:hypothetical protein